MTEPAARVMLRCSPTAVVYEESSRKTATPIYSANPTTMAAAAANQRCLDSVRAAAARNTPCRGVIPSFRCSNSTARHVGESCLRADSRRSCSASDSASPPVAGAATPRERFSADQRSNPLSSSRRLSSNSYRTFAAICIAVNPLRSPQPSARPTDPACFFHAGSIAPSP
jgi:hypothetical protein